MALSDEFRRIVHGGVPGARVRYEWMALSLFRRFRAEASFAAFRAVVGHWAATMRAAEAWNLDNEVHFVAAQCYPLVAESISLQDVYKDAYLKPASTNPTADGLSDDIRKRIRRVVRERDAGLVRAELDQVLGRFEPLARLMTLLREAFRRSVGSGVVELRHAGNDGFEPFLKEADHWSRGHGGPEKHVAPLALGGGAEVPTKRPRHLRAVRAVDDAVLVPRVHDQRGRARPSGTPPTTAAVPWTVSAPTQSGCPKPGSGKRFWGWLETAAPHRQIAVDGRSPVES